MIKIDVFVLEGFKDLSIVIVLFLVVLFIFRVGYKIVMLVVLVFVVVMCLVVLIIV